MFNTIMTLFFTGWAPYYIYKSLKRKKLSHKLSGITAAMLAIFIITGTHPPINLDHNRAFGLLGMAVSIELFYVAYKEKKPFLGITAGILALLGFLLFALQF